MPRLDQTQRTRSGERRPDCLYAASELSEAEALTDNDERANMIWAHGARLFCASNPLVQNEKQVTSC